MDISKVSVPEIYKTSDDFRFFLKWFENSLSRIQYDTENMSDLYDPLRCPEDLLWMLADTIGYKYDDRLPTSFNRLVLLYFMSMIRNRGSKDGVTLAAETNLAQFNVLNYGKENDILYNRLEDTNIPVNSAYVTPHTSEGYIDVVYFSTEIPIDACIEYVRPLGMYTFQFAGVRLDARTKISIDPRLTNINDENSDSARFGPSRVGHYSRRDYASMQQMYVENGVEENPETHMPKVVHTVNSDAGRRKAWYRNSVAEDEPTVNAGYRALDSLQLCNNEHIVKSLLEPIFGLGLYPIDPDDVVVSPMPNESDIPKAYNLRYDKGVEVSQVGTQTVLKDTPMSVVDPNPKVNKIADEIPQPFDENSGD